jgi:hypothetical protein
MSKFMFQGAISATVNDSDDLPEGMSQDDVFNSLRAALQRAADDWYAANPGLLSCEPDVF